MKKQILLAGLLGGIVILMWSIVSQTMLPFKRYYTLKTFPDQLEIHRLLKERITQPGIYVCPYFSTYEEAIQLESYGDQPIFSISYTGATHNTVGSLLSLCVLAIFVAPTIAAWMLSVTSPKILSSYARRVVFVAALGLFLAIFGDWLRQMEDTQPTGLIVFLMVNSLITWVLAGLVIAWRVKPAPH